ncbi:MAG: neuraminidase, partial [Paludibacter sp.]|nr:neuraminidase [Paludibacter sp.]
MSVFSQKLTPIADAWAGNSVNAVVFRKNSVVTHGKTQFAAFYNQQGKLVLAKRMLNSEDWEISETQYSGNIR